MNSTPVVTARNGIALFTRGEAIQAGMTDKDLRSPEYLRVIHGVYTHAEIPLTHKLKCRAAALTIPPDAIITGRSAATLSGVELAGPSDPVEIVVSGHKYMNRRFGLRCWARQSSPDEHMLWDRVQLATPYRAAYDLLARHTIRYGIAYCDAMVHSGLVREDQLGMFLTTRKYYGIYKARRAFELVDGRAESIPESLLRVLLVQEGLHPTPQLVIHDERGFVARVDLGYPLEKVAVEYDGAWHADPLQVRRDAARRARLRASGWHVIVITADRLRNDQHDVVAEVRAALRRAA